MTIKLMTQNMKKYLLEEMINLLMEIQQKKIPNTNIWDININKKIYILNSLIYHRPLNINIYTNILLPIVTNEKCNKCDRIAIYIKDKNLFCWIHCQNI